MKFIFDFDDVIFQTTKHRLESIYTTFEVAGVPMVDIETYYKRVREQGFSLTKMVEHFSIPEKFHKKILQDILNFKNTKLIQILEKLGKANCYILSYGDNEFQLQKIKILGIEPLFFEIIILPDDHKKEILEEICTRHKDEDVIFIDDKAKHLANIDFTRCPNLKTILFDKNGLEKMESLLKI